MLTHHSEVPSESDEVYMPQETSSAFESIDPTLKATLAQKIDRCSIGKTPSAFYKVRADLSPPDLIKLIGYDPRMVSPKAKTPGNISRELEELIREVQRTIDQSRVDEMVEYLRNAVESEGYADWSEIDIITQARPDTTHYSAAHYVEFPQAAEYFITDGQHRYCAILDFVRQYPQLATKFTVAIAIGVLPEEHLNEWAGQSFHDKNYLQKLVKATKALAVDMRDLHNRLAKEMHGNKVIKGVGGINVYKDSLAAGALEFTTHAVLYKFVRGFTEGHRGVFKGLIKNPMLTEENYETLKKNLSEYLDMLSEMFPTWMLHPDREDYLFRASAALQGLGSLGFLLWNKIDDKAVRKQLLANVGERAIDWKRANWQTWGPVIGRVVEGADGERYVSPSSNRQTVEGTAKFLRDKSGVNAYVKDDDSTKDIEA